MRTGNPMLTAGAFEGAATHESANVMTVGGAVTKTMALLVLVVIAAAYSWQSASAAMQAGGGNVMILIVGGAIGGFIFCLITSFMPRWAAVTAPIYAVLEGLFLGGISALIANSLAAEQPGLMNVPFQAACLTFGTMFAMLAAYQMGIVRATEKFRMGVIAATGAVLLFYLAAIVLSFFGVEMSVLHSSGPLGIGISLAIIVIAALNLVLDFDLIERGAAVGAPKYMEWYAAFGLLVTLVWLYIEFLRLLSKLNRD